VDRIAVQHSRPGWGGGSFRRPSGTPIVWLVGYPAMNRWATFTASLAGRETVSAGRAAAQQGLHRRRARHPHPARVGGACRARLAQIGAAVTTSGCTVLADLPRDAPTGARVFAPGPREATTDARVFAPQGAKGCSHGWSAARLRRAERNPWTGSRFNTPAPDGAEGVSVAPPGRKEDKGDGVHGFRSPRRARGVAHPWTSWRKNTAAPDGAEGASSARAVSGASARADPWHAAIGQAPAAQGRGAPLDRVAR
jgi:hypothetical protein